MLYQAAALTEYTDLAYFTIRVPDTSDTSATRMQQECDMNEMSVT